MAMRPQAQVSLSTSFLGAEQTAGVGARYLEFGLDDAAIAWTLRITGKDSVEYLVECSAGQVWSTPQWACDLGDDWTYNAKSASGTPKLQILAVY
jgi:hypothetical protein